MTDPALCLNDATALAALIRERAVSPVEVVDAFLTRIEALNPAINAFCVVAAEEARTARGSTRAPSPTRTRSSSSARGGRAGSCWARR